MLASVFEVEDRHLAPTYQKLPVALVRGRGCYVWDVEGRRYLDCTSSYGVALLGHCHPKVVEAIKRQAEVLITCHGSLYSEARAAFLERLFKLMPRSLSRAFLSNSGAEAVECALKLARKYTGRREVVAMVKSYHGKTMGALSATWDPKYRSPFEPLVPGFKFVPYGRADKLREAVSENTAAVVLEPIQGEGGVNIPPRDYLKQVRELCDERGALMILDEVQTGLGRTGRMWAFEHFNAIPDVVCLAKAVAGGIPMGVTVAREDVMNSLKVGEHSTTFGGNPLACSAASAVLDVIVEEKLPERAWEVGSYFRNRLQEELRDVRLVREVRGIGLMLAVELRLGVIPRVMSSLASGGLLALYSGLNIVRLLPPLIISRSEVEEAVEKIKLALIEEQATLQAMGRDLGST
ncbi:MAG: aspartate aminotransferase family protein [Candidatus Nezhaarchaeota archaeon]|nr:aspartate aminotransferase family protein [Candidatus Nezhaarchaeota archaeon]